MKRFAKESSPFGFVGVAEFARITGYGESTVRNMIRDGLLGDAIRSSDKANGELKINVWLALEARGLSEDSIQRLRKHLRLDQVAEVLPPAPSGFTVTVIVSGVPVQLLSFAPAVASR